jgi:hypothetical protein
VEYPVDIDIPPLMPFTPASGVFRNSLPLVEATLTPADTTTSPPINASPDAAPPSREARPPFIPSAIVSPAAKCSSLPSSDAVEPGFIETDPALFSESPEKTDISPLDAELADCPEESVIGPLPAIESLVPNLAVPLRSFTLTPLMTWTLPP